MKSILLTFLVLVAIPALSQDIIKTVDGKVLEAKVIEVNESAIKYRLANNLDGPLYTLERVKINQITYANGTVEAYSEDGAERDARYRKLEKEKISEIFKKGNKVYVTKELEVHEDAVRYLREALDEWGYWVTVDKSDDADFTIQYLFDKKFMDMRSAKAILKTRNGIVFKESPEYKRGASSFNGWNGSRHVAKLVVEKYLKKEFSK